MKVKGQHMMDLEIIILSKVGKNTGVGLQMLKSAFL